MILRPSSVEVGNTWNFTSNPFRLKPFSSIEIEWQNGRSEGTGGGRPGYMAVVCGCSQRCGCMWIRTIRAGQA